MSTQAEQIRDQQQAAWDKFSAGWKKWDELVLGWLEKVGTTMLDGVQLQTDSFVLDIASGTGEPALTAAERCPKGKVMMTDLAMQMLEIAKDNAVRRNLLNVETHQCDASTLSFADNTFDAVMARFGFMFFPDVLGAAREFVRVAKPGARVCAAVWDVPEKNSWATTFMGSISQHVEIPASPPGAPGLFRCAAPGYMAKVFREVGLANVTEQEVHIPLQLPDPEQYFNFITDISAPVVALMAKADETTREKIKQNVLEVAGQRARGNSLHFDASAIVIWGEKQH